MKKNKFKYTLFSLAFAALSVISCEENFTDLDRGFVLIEDTIENIDDVERLMAGAYNALTYTTIYSRNSLASDEARIGFGNRGQGLQEHAYTITSGNGAPTGLWNGSYNTLDNLNRVLRFLDNIAIDPADADRASSIRGQALGLRAMTHFDLLRAFAVDLNPSSPGVILATDVFVFGGSDLAIPRSSVGDVLASVNQDLIDAAALVPASLDADYEFFNRNAVNALRARVALYTGQYQDAIDFSTAVIDVLPALAPLDYFNMFRNDASPDDTLPNETIFQLERDEVDNGAIGAIWNATNEDIFFSMSQGLFDAMSEANDVRLALNLDEESAITSPEATADELVIGKFIGRSSALRSLNHVPIFRTSEMILIRAEANARLMRFSTAQADIESLRTIRESETVTPTYTNVDNSTMDILKERRIELAFEGHRFFDLKRFGLAVSRLQDDCNNPGRTAPTTCDLAVGDFRFTYPIPQAELFSNPGITDADQNPGY